METRRGYPPLRDNFNAWRSAQMTGGRRRRGGVEGKLCLLPVSRRRSEEERTRSRRGDVGGGAGFEECRGERSLARERERERKGKRNRGGRVVERGRRGEWPSSLPPSLSLSFKEEELQSRSLPSPCLSPERKVRREARATLVSREIEEEEESHPPNLICGKTKLSPRPTAFWQDKGPF